MRCSDIPGRLRSTAFIFTALTGATPLFAEMASGVWPAAKAPAGVVAPAGYRYVWGDEFDGKDGSAPDPAKWGYARGFHGKEAQYYTKDRRENARIEKGRLVVEARREDFNEAGKSAGYTSANVISENKFAFKYGRVEISAKLPKGVGTWPALWMMGQDSSTVGWPACGEIDIMEHLGYREGTVYCTLHTPGPTPEKKYVSEGGTLAKQTTTEAFHVYGMDWTEDALTLTFDGKPVYTHSRKGPNPKELTACFDKPYYFLMNVAVGGGWGGAKGIDEKAFPARMEIEYVRVFQKGAEPAVSAR